MDYVCVILQNITTKHNWPRGCSPPGCQFPPMSQKRMFRAKAMNVFVKFVASAVAAWKGSSSSTLVHGILKIYVAHSLATSQLHLLLTCCVKTGLGDTMNNIQTKSMECSIFSFI